MLRPLSRRGRWPLALTLLALGACADEPAAPRPPRGLRPNANLGDVITVTNTSGGKDMGSLRWAIAQTSGGEIVRFAPTLAGATIVVDSTIPVAYPITIEGPADKGVTISGGNAWHIFAIQPSLPSATTFRNLSLVNGKGSGSAGGGGILASSDVVLENVTLSHHNGLYYAAMYVDGNATLTNTTISSNTTDIDGAVFVEKKLTLVNSTIAYNNKGGVDVRGALSIRNSIITHNGAGANCEHVPTFERYGRNLADDETCGDATVMIIAPAKLDSLADNGGPGKTHRLMPQSPAIDAGTECTVTVDQRYTPRDAQCDLGAYEFKDFTTATITVNSKLGVDRNTGYVLAAGTIKCSANDAFDLSVEVSQEQKAGKSKNVVTAVGTVAVTCTKTAQPWAVALAPSNGSFVVADAVVTTAPQAAWVTPLATSATTKLHWGPK